MSDDLPASYITWNDAVAYCKWLSEQEKTTYRLPTEAEWEYACRAGTTTQFSFGDDYSDLPKYGWHNKNAARKSHSVGTLLPNNFGLFDMHGNLQEWCGDFFDEKWYETTLTDDPNGPAIGAARMIRGGVWKFDASLCRSATRSLWGQSFHNADLGFRIVRELPAPATTASVTLPATAAVGKITTRADPSFQQWLKDVSALTPEKQVEAVVAKLQELNPGYDGKHTHKIEKGIVTELELKPPGIVDLSPVRVLAGLKAFHCFGQSVTKDRVWDLSPLRGLPLEKLELRYNFIADLSPLAGMPLTFLDVQGTRVADLSPLVGTPLSSLRIGSTKVTDLSPLAGMPVKQLICNSTAVSDLSPLATCKDLKSVEALDTRVDAATVATLQKALPNCKIVWDDPAKPATPVPPADPIKSVQ